MTISQSLETLRIHVRNLKFSDDRTYAEDPVSGEVKLENPYMGENVEKTREKLMKAVENASEEALRLLYAFALGLTG